MYDLLLLWPVVLQHASDMRQPWGARALGWCPLTFDGVVQNEVSTRNANYATIVRNLRFTPHLWYEPSGWSAGLDRRHEQKHARTPESSEFSMPQLSIEQMALQQQVRHTLRTASCCRRPCIVWVVDSCPAVHLIKAALLAAVV